MVVAGEGLRLTAVEALVKVVVVAAVERQAAQAAQGEVLLRVVLRVLRHLMMSQS